MKKYAQRGLEYYQFESFDNHLVTHGFFTRKGGVSPAPWCSLNQGGTVGDQRENVIENRRRIFEVLGRPINSIYDVWQVHGNDVVCTENARPLDSNFVKADAIVTNKPEITLFMRFADCVPIMVYDPIKNVAGIIHAGWKGTVNKIVTQTIRTLETKFKCDPETLVAGIGPSIGVCHYQVGTDVIEDVQTNFRINSDEFLIRQDGKVFFDLWKTNEYLLKESGVKSVEVSNLCTACHTEDWYSHRAEKGKTGRFGAVLYLNGTNHG